MVESLMKYTTWKRNDGHVLVIRFKNGTAVAVSIKTFKTKKGAMSFGERVAKRCSDPQTGAPWGKEDLPWFTGDPETGERTYHFRREAVGNI